MRHRIDHTLNPELAKQAAEAALSAYAARFAHYAPRVDWTGDDAARVSFAVRGLRLRGGLRLEPNAIVPELDVPFLFRPLAGRATAVVEREVRGWLERAEKGAL